MCLTQQVSNFVQHTPHRNWTQDEVILTWAFRFRYCLTRYASYSLCKRRRHSSTMTRQITPMQEPANFPFEVMRQVEEIKQESTVYQFQSIYHQRRFLVS